MITAANQIIYELIDWFARKFEFYRNQSAPAPAAWLLGIDTIAADAADRHKAMQSTSKSTPGDSSAATQLREAGWRVLKCRQYSWFTCKRLHAQVAVG